MPVYENNQLLSLLNSLDTAVMVIGCDDGILEYSNQKVSRDMGLPMHELLGSHYRDVFQPEFITLFNELQETCLDGASHSLIYYWAEMTMWEQVVAKKIPWNGKASILLSIGTVSEIARSEYKFESIAYFDSLLKLPNGKKLEEDLNQLSDYEDVAMIYISIEHFNEINNLYGWHNGDFILLQIRDWLLTSERNRIQLYRVDNGFVIWGKSVTRQDAHVRACEIIERFKKPWIVQAAGSSLQAYCTAKLGIVLSKQMKNEMRNLLLRTVQAPKNEYGYSEYDEAADRALKEELNIRNALIHCLNNNMEGFSVVYQPLVDLESGRWFAVEALCRWRMLDGTSVPPIKFIKIAEQLGLISGLETWVWETAMKRCVELGLHEKDFMLDVNFSPSRPINDSFLRHLNGILERTGFPAEKLNLEVTESEKVEFTDETLEGLKRITETGVMLSLDDFGTGYSSMENLIHIAVRAVKTEKLFLDGIEGDSYRQYLLKFLVTLAERLDMSLVAEGVETHAQQDILKEIGVKYVQGFLHSRPLTSEQLSEKLEHFD